MVNRHVQARLRQDLVAWLVTVGGARPHAVLVWFLWDGETFLVYSQPGRKVKDIERNSNVAMHLNSDPEGSDAVRIEGTAEIDRGQPPADRFPAYLRKYRDQIQSLGMTPAGFAERYGVAIRIRPARFQE